MAERKVRPIRVEGNLAYVSLSRGYEATIDIADVSLAEGFNWYAFVGANTFYAARKEWLGGVNRVVLLHRVLVAAPKGMDVDHVDHDGLNNRRANLRVATRAENMRNIKRHKDNSSGFKGVSWSKSDKRWRAQISVNGKNMHIGNFTTPEAAHAAYCAVAHKIHGEFVRTA